MLSYAPGVLGAVVVVVKVVAFYCHHLKRQNSPKDSNRTRKAPCLKDQEKLENLGPSRAGRSLAVHGSLSMGQFLNFQQKSDYENSPSQISNQNLPVVAQPMSHPMVPNTQPMSNMGNQMVQNIEYNLNQMPSQSAMVNSTAGQVIAPITPLAESEVKPLPQINKPQNEPSQTDFGDDTAMNTSKLEIQQNVE